MSPANDHRLNILVIPGLQPPGTEAVQRVTYHAVLWRWRAAGYRVTVCQFGWYRGGSFAERHRRMLERVDQLPGELVVIGTSAGGLEAVNVLADRPDRVRRVVTIASPLQLEAPLRPRLGRLPRLVSEAYDRADGALRQDELRRRVVSLYGQADGLVPPRWSQRPGVTCHQVPGHGHAVTIFRTLGAGPERLPVELANLG